MCGKHPVKFCASCLVCKICPIVFAFLCCRLYILIILLDYHTFSQLASLILLSSFQIKKSTQQACPFRFRKWPLYCLDSHLSSNLFLTWGYYSMGFLPMQAKSEIFWTLYLVYTVLTIVLCAPCCIFCRIICTVWFSKW